MVQNSFSDSFGATNSLFNLSIWGTFVATVTIQKKLRDEDSTAWRDLQSFTTATEQIIQSVGPWEYRVGVKTGDFTSGTVNIAMVD